MSDEGACSLIAKAESETLDHLTYLKRNIRFSLYFTFFLFLINLVNYETLLIGRFDDKKIGEILAWMPPPVLFLSLAVSAAYLYSQLKKLKLSINDLSSLIRTEGTKEADAHGKSLTDINYGIVEVVEKSLRIWPWVAVLFLLYIISGALSLIAWSAGALPGYDLTALNLLNLVTYVVIIGYFLYQTKHWFLKRRQMRALAEMERTVKEELKI